MPVVSSSCRPCISALYLVAVLLVGVPLYGRAAAPPATRSELIFALSSAVKERNKEAILACFNLDGADEAMRRTIDSAVTQICRWPTSHVFTTERSGNGPLRSARDGKTWSLNGDWEFQVHIFLKQGEPSKGFVFPAGKTPGSNPHYAVLLLVEQNH